MRICHRCTQDSPFWQTVKNSFERANNWQFKVWTTLAESDSKFKDINGKCFKGQINKIYKKIKEIGKLLLSEIFYWLALSAFQKEINLWSWVQNPFGESTSPACGISLVKSLWNLFSDHRRQQMHRREQTHIHLISQKGRTPSQK